MNALASRWTLPIVALGVGWAAGLSGTLYAEDAPPPDSGIRACRTFAITVEDGQGGYFVTSDRTGPVGEWVGARVDEGWRVDAVDYEVGQRVTGYAEHRVMVCVAR
ncbi:MAG: hypothetical protein JXB39_06945 [Deltaproteobacteria bacterium]|nr:hypothetical protein [Deltaproteobacteria bacterium]